MVPDWSGATEREGLREPHLRFFESQEAATVAAELDTLLLTQVSHGNSYLVAYTWDNWPEPKFTGLASHNYAV